jgi:hypothetical protein
VRAIAPRRKTVGTARSVTTPVADLAATTTSGGAAGQIAIASGQSTISQPSMSGSPERSMSGPGTGPDNRPSISA